MYNTMENSLYHHGIDGQKWGQRNGPPYPLKRGIAGVIQRHKYNQEQKKQEKAAANHEKLVNTASAKTVQRHRGEFTDEELNKIYSRLNAEKKINDIAANDTKNAIENVKGYLSTAVNMATSGVQMYNLMAYVNNSVTGDSGKKWPVINTNPQSETAKAKAQAELETAQSNARKAKADANKAIKESNYTDSRLANEAAQARANREQTEANTAQTRANIENNRRTTDANVRQTEANTEKTYADAESTRARAESTRATTARADAEASRTAQTYEDTHSYATRTAAANARKAEADARLAAANATAAKKKDK